MIWQTWGSRILTFRLAWATLSKSGIVQQVLFFANPLPWKRYSTQNSGNRLGIELSGRKGLLNVSWALNSVSSTVERNKTYTSPGYQMVPCNMDYFQVNWIIINSTMVPLYSGGLIQDPIRTKIQECSIPYTVLAWLTYVVYYFKYPVKCKSHINMIVLFREWQGGKRGHTFSIGTVSPPTLSILGQFNLQVWNRTHAEAGCTV